MDPMTESRPRIALLTTGLGKGGAETQLVRLARHLRRRGWSVLVISILEPASFVDLLEGDGIPVERLGMDRARPDPIALLRLVRILKRDRPDVLLSFMYHANVLGRLAGRAAGVPAIVASIRNERFGGAWRERLERWTEPLSDSTITNSQLAARSLVERGVVRRERLRVIPNGIPTASFDRPPDHSPAVARESLGVPEGAFLWLAVGHLEEQKDYPTLLEAIRTLSEGDANPHLWIAGEGSRRGDLAGLADSLGIASRVKLLGIRHDVPDLLHAADAYVMSSAWEGMPNAVMEAHAASRAVVATRVGGIPELVEDEVSGFLVPPRDPPALSAAMLRMMKMAEEERASMGAAGRSLVEENFDVEKVMRTWEEHLTSLISRRPPDQARLRASGSGATA